MDRREQRRQRRNQLARERRAATRRNPTWIDRAASWCYEHFWTYAAVIVGMVAVAFLGRVILQ